METTCILAIETALQGCTIALKQEDQRAIRSAPHANRQGQVILTMIQACLDELQLTLEALDYLVLSHGPGRFTGLRLGASVAQSVAYVQHIPVVLVSTLQAIAQTVYETMQHESVLVTLNAHMDEFYVGNYTLKAGWMEPVVPDYLIKAEALPTLVQGYSGYIVTDEKATLSPEVLLALGAKKYAQGHRVSAEHALPVYLREKSAWVKGNQR